MPNRRLSNSSSRQLSGFGTSANNAPLCYRKNCSNTISCLMHWDKAEASDKFSPNTTTPFRPPEQANVLHPKCSNTPISTNSIPSLWQNFGMAEHQTTRFAGTDSFILHAKANAGHCFLSCLRVYKSKKSRRYPGQTEAAYWKSYMKTPF